MDSAAVAALKAAGQQERLVRRKVVTVRGQRFYAVLRNFMLPDPRPVDEGADVDAARAALAESDERILYDQVRRDLGL